MREARLGASTQEFQERHYGNRTNQMEWRNGNFGIHSVFFRRMRDVVMAIQSFQEIFNMLSDYLGSLTNKEGAVAVYEDITMENLPDNIKQCWELISVCPAIEEMSFKSLKDMLEDHELDDFWKLVETLGACNYQNIFDPLAFLPFALTQQGMMHAAKRVALKLTGFNIRFTSKERTELLIFLAAEIRRRWNNPHDQLWETSYQKPRTSPGGKKKKKLSDQDETTLNVCIAIDCDVEPLYFEVLKLDDSLRTVAVHNGSNLKTQPQKSKSLKNLFTRASKPSLPTMLLPIAYHLPFLRLPFFPKQDLASWAALEAQATQYMEKEDNPITMTTRKRSLRTQSVRQELCTECHTGKIGYFRYFVKHIRSSPTDKCWNCYTHKKSFIEGVVALLEDQKRREFLRESTRLRQVTVPPIAHVERSGGSMFNPSGGYDSSLWSNRTQDAGIIEADGSESGKEISNQKTNSIGMMQVSNATSPETEQQEDLISRETVRLKAIKKEIIELDEHPEFTEVPVEPEEEYDENHEEENYEKDIQEEVTPRVTINDFTESMNQQFIANSIEGLKTIEKFAGRVSSVIREQIEKTKTLWKEMTNKGQTDISEEFFRNLKNNDHEKICGSETRNWILSVKKNLLLKTKKNLTDFHVELNHTYSKCWGFFKQLDDEVATSLDDCVSENHMDACDLILEWEKVVSRVMAAIEEYLNDQLKRRLFQWKRWMNKQLVEDYKKHGIEYVETVFTERNRIAAEAQQNKKAERAKSDKTTRVWQNVGDFITDWTARALRNDLPSMDDKELENFIENRTSTRKSGAPGRRRGKSAPVIQQEAPEQLLPQDTPIERSEGQDNVVANDYQQEQFPEKIQQLQAPQQTLPQNVSLNTSGPLDHTVSTNHQQVQLTGQTQQFPTSQTPSPQNVPREKVGPPDHVAPMNYHQMPWSEQHPQLHVSQQSLPSSFPLAKTGPAHGAPMSYQLEQRLSMQNQQFQVPQQHFSQNFAREPNHVPPSKYRKVQSPDQNQNFYYRQPQNPPPHYEFTAPPVQKPYFRHQLNDMYPHPRFDPNHYYHPCVPSTSSAPNPSFVNNPPQYPDANNYDPWAEGNFNMAGPSQPQYSHQL